MRYATCPLVNLGWHDPETGQKRDSIAGLDNKSPGQLFEHAGYDGYLARLDGTQPGQAILLGQKTVEPEVLATIEQTLAGFASADGEASIIRFDHLNTRKAGQRRFVDMHMHMPASWTLGRAAAVRGSVEQALMSAVPGLRATIQLLPSDVEAHFDDEKDLI